MTWLTWTLLISYVLLSVVLARYFEKAGENPKSAYIPIYNFMVWSKIIGRKSSYGLLMLVPVLNIFIFSALAVDLARSFGRFAFWEHFAAVVVSPFYFGWLSTQKDLTYKGPVMQQERAYLAKMEEAKKAGNERELNKLIRQNPLKKSTGREWAESAIFAIFAATFIRLLFIEPYIIPTPSMEGSLMVGDFLFVSKVHYGMRLPETVAQLPLVHNRAPFVGGESYWEKPSLPYRRLPALEGIDRYDPVVFNMPAGDSVYVFPDRVWTDMDYRSGVLGNDLTPSSYYRAIRSKRNKLITRPRDKKDLYVKRAVGLPGETLELKDRKLFIDGEEVEDPSTIQFRYVVRFPDSPNRRKWAEWGIAEDDVEEREGTMFLNQEQLDQLKADNPNMQAEFYNYDNPQLTGNRYYPHDATNYGSWSNDNFGPIWIPRAGETVQLTPENYSIYFRPIKVYEGNDVEKRGDQILINGEVATEYTFQQDYYWMMGDNRHNSEDSRVWGFVPMDHVVGKPLFIWFSIRENSLSKGINWSRIFTSADKQ